MIGSSLQKSGHRVHNPTVTGARIFHESASAGTGKALAEQGKLHLRIAEDDMTVYLPKQKRMWAMHIAYNGSQAVVWDLRGDLRAPITP